jgi:hypothetical protein
LCLVKKKMSFSPPTLQLLSSVAMLNNLIKESYYHSCFKKDPNFERMIKLFLENNDEQLCVNLYWNKKICDVRSLCLTPYRMHMYLQSRYISYCTSVVALKE